MLLLFTVLAWMTSLAPGRDHMANAVAITTAIMEVPPLFKGDEDKTRTAALSVAIAFRESSFRNDVASPTNDHCLFQINRRPDLAKDPAACARVAIVMLRESMRMCPDHPIAFYAAGPGACSNERAKRISNDRMHLSRSLFHAAGRSP